MNHNTIGPLLLKFHNQDDWFLLLGKEMHLSGLKEMQKLSGSISFIHVDDLARAHMFLAEKETASGRYICCYYNTNVPEIADFLRRRYTKYNVLSE